MIRTGARIALAFVIVLAGCLGEAATAPGDPDPAFVCPVRYIVDQGNTYSLQNDWRLFGFQGGGSLQITVPPCEAFSAIQAEFTMGIEFSADSNLIGGNAGINAYGGKYHLDVNNTLKLDSMVSTKMGGSKEVVDFENRFLIALRETERYEIQHNVLTLFYGPQRDKMIFVASPH